MIRMLVRHLLAGVLGLAAAGAVQGQTLEAFAGGRAIDNLPATEAPITTGPFIMDVQGTVYFVDQFRTRLMRRDPITGIVTRFPAGATEAWWRAVDSVFASRYGHTFVVAGWALYRLDLPAGTTELITRLDGGGPSIPCTASLSSEYAADIQGTVYFTDPTRHYVCKVVGNGNIQPIAGGFGFAGDGGPASGARFNTPSGIAIDVNNYIYIADYGNNRVRKIDANTGIVSTFAGNGGVDYIGDTFNFTNAPIPGPAHLSLDNQQRLYVTEIGTRRVRRLNPFSLQMVTVAGNGQTVVNSPDGGLATQTPLNWPTFSNSFLNGGDLLVSDGNDSRVRRIHNSTGIISTFIGNGTYYFCGENSAPLDACIDNARGLAVDPNDDVYISDSNNRRIRKYSVATGQLTTFAGRHGPNGYSGDGLPANDVNFGHSLEDIQLDAAGNLYVALGFGNRLLRIDASSGIVTTIAGTGVSGFTGDGGPATAARTNYVASVAIDSSGNVFFSDRSNHRVRKVAAGSGVITTVAGTGSATGALGDGGQATAASLAYPQKVGFDRDGHLLIADTQHFRIRRVHKTTGVITTVVGNGTSTNSGDGGSATSAGLNGVDSFAVDLAGHLYLISQGNVRRVNYTNGRIERVPNIPVSTPEGFWITGPRDLELDSSGNLYIAGTEAVLRVRDIPPIQLDTTPPRILLNWSGSVQTNGWFRGNIPVSVFFPVYDDESFVTSREGCGPHTVNSDTAGITFTCTATSAGGTATLSFTVRRDSVAPTLVFGTPSPAPDAAGWNSTDVGVPFTASDALSGVFSTSSGSPVIVTGEGTNLTSQVVVTDTAGNSATFTTPAFRIDRSAPVVTPVVSGTLGNNGWYRSDVQVSWTTSDPNASITSTEGCTTSLVTVDTTGQTFTCTATSAGGSTTASVTVLRDTTAPTLEFGVPTTPANNGWHNADVSIPFTTQDTGSGVVTVSTPSPVVITGTGADLTTSIDVVDAAGNSATFTSPAVSIDRSAPTVTPQIAGVSGANGWFTSDVTVSWTVSDDGAPVLDTDGCESVSITSDTAAATFTCTANSGGGSTTQSVTIQRDATAPQIEFGTASPAPNGAGWYSGDVSIPFTVSDGMSGIASSSASPALITGEGANLSATISVADAAGNTASFTTPPVNIDRSAPAVQAQVTGTLGANGWYTSDVQVNWAIDESPGNILSSTGCGPSSVTADTTGVTFTCSVVSGGGNAAASVTIKRDTTPPQLTFGSASPVPNSAGWNKTNVSIPYTASDATSGLASASAPSPVLLSTEGAGVTGAVSLTDNAGNSVTFTTIPRNIDKTAPVVSITSPVNGVIYGFYQDLPADFACTDTSLRSCTGTVADGAMVNTRTAGTRTFTATGRDEVSFVTSATHTFTVMSFFNWEGFLAPLQGPPTLNLVPRGSLVPIRWRLPDGNGGFVTNTASFASATVGSLSCGGGPTVPLNDTATGPAGISFDPGTSSFVYNWQTSASWTGCRKLTIRLRDNSTWEARFRFQ
jgi:sugar lactone lactonase YvrE